MPLANAEAFVGSFIKYMLKWFVMYNMRIKGIFNIGGQIFLDKEHGEENMAGLDAMQKDVLANAQARADAGKGGAARRRG